MEGVFFGKAVANAATAFCFVFRQPSEVPLTGQACGDKELGSSASASLLAPVSNSTFSLVAQPTLMWAFRLVPILPRGLRSLYCVDQNHDKYHDVRHSTLHHASFFCPPP